MTENTNALKRTIEEMATRLGEDSELELQHYTLFLQEPHLALELIDLIETLPDNDEEEERAYFSACAFALDICVAQLKSQQENENKTAAKTLTLLMAKIAKAIKKGKQSLSFWLPVLNSFYEVHLELSEELRNAYLDLANREDEFTPQEEVNYLDNIREIINELSDLSDFAITENFFAQSYAMPPDFFIDLILDLYSIEQGQDIALLTLLHPKQEVREVVVATLEQLMDKITLSSISLTRLQAIKNWFPKPYQEQMNRWIKMQRKKGVVFQSEPAKPVLRIKASEIDGSGAQGIFIQLKKNKKNRLCGLLIKQDLGIKDAWITPEMNASEVDKYYKDAFDGSIVLREVDESYLTLLTGHFLACTLAKGEMPDLHLFEIQEVLGIHFYPNVIDVQTLIEELSVQIMPFTPDAMYLSFRRSQKWPKLKRCADSWFIENAHVDKLVNRCCSFVDGVKICALEEAMAAVFTYELETHRDKWLFHFLWTALWARAKERKKEKFWQDCFFIAYAIYQGEPLTTIPIMREICRHTVLNSIETMQKRRTYLNLK